MACKVVLLFASALFVKTISGQAIGAFNSIAGTALAAEELALAGNALAYGSNQVGRGFAAGPLGYPGSCGLSANSIVPSSGGGFAVTSVSPIAPTGITVLSENAIEGAVAVNGELPFLSAVALEGALPSAGSGGINYGCGNGAVGIVSEGIAPATGVASSRAGYGPGLVGSGLAGLGYNGRAGASCGYTGPF